MERKIGEQFEWKGISYIVRENCCLSHGWFRRRRLDCNLNCVFWNGFKCKGALAVTGDCQDKWRKDNTSVFFEDARLV